MYNYKRHLPHWLPKNKAVFLTWRLYGSLPRTARLARVDETAGEEFVRLDRELDLVKQGPAWLRDPRIALLVSEPSSAVPTSGSIV